MNENFKDHDWINELKDIQIATAQNDQQSCFVIDHYRVPNENMYKDLEGMIQQGICTAALEKTDMVNILAGIMKSEGFDKKPIPKKETSDSQASMYDEINEMDKKPTYNRQVTMAHLNKQNKAALMQRPDDMAKLLQHFQRRVRKNLHVVMVMAPSGNDFRELLTRHQTLMITA